MSRRNSSLLGAYVAIALTLAGGVLYWWQGRPAGSGAPSQADTVAAAREANAGGLSPAATASAQDAAQTAFANRYKDATYGFSFTYPDPLTVGASDDPNSGAHTVLVQDTANHVGFQIVVSAWAGGAITQEKVLHDLPQIEAHDFKPISLGGAQGVTFAAADENFGDSLQAWLVHGSELYQISTYATQGVLLSKVLGTWQWQ